VLKSLRGGELLDVVKRLEEKSKCPGVVGATPSRRGLRTMEGGRARHIRNGLRRCRRPPREPDPLPGTSTGCRRTHRNSDCIAGVNASAHQQRPHSDPSGAPAQLQTTCQRGDHRPCMSDHRPCMSAVNDWLPVVLTQPDAALALRPTSCCDGAGTGWQSVLAGTSSATQQG
jgi:hypothetical protein